MPDRRRRRAPGRAIGDGLGSTAGAARDAAALAQTMGVYWLTLFPVARRELRRVRRRAQAIPDPVLRAHALQTLGEEGGNAESAAAFAVLAAPRHRRATARMLVAYQVLYDFLDTLTEQPAEAALPHSRRLHGALVGALGAPRPPGGYYPEGHPDDGGYLDDLVRACAGRFDGLPGADTVRRPLRRAAERAGEGQSQNHAAMFANRDGLVRWALAEPPSGTGLSWWETAAAAGSSLSMHALLGAAGDPALTPRDAERIERAYWPWVNALNTLLESLVDEEEDAVTGNHSYVGHYRSLNELADRLGMVAARAAGATHDLPRARAHAVIVAAVAAYYLVQLPAADPASTSATDHVRSAFDGYAPPLLAVLRLRRRLAR